MNATILALGTSVPTHFYSQAEVANKFIEILNIESEAKKQALRRIYQQSAIQKRHAIISDFNKERSEWDFLGADYPVSVPGMSARNAIYKKEAPRLAQEAAQQAIERWGGSPDQITHVISVSCTGMMAPGIEYYLMQALKLPASVNRLAINFMGCFGAFKGLSVARAFALENPHHRVLVVCTELCSLHMQADQDTDTLVANAIFADGSAAVIVGQAPRNYETPLWEMTRSYAIGLEESLDKMSWEASDRGFLMRLSPTVPVLIRRHIQAFMDQLLLEEIDPHHCEWAIHPGGKSIIQAIERVFELAPDHTQAAWDTLANYGNMSSATFLFVLDQLSRQATLRPWSVGVAFGPGLSIEGILLRAANSKE